MSSGLAQPYMEGVRDDHVVTRTSAEGGVHLLYGFIHRSYSVSLYPWVPCSSGVVLERSLMN